MTDFKDKYNYWLKNVSERDRMQLSSMSEEQIRENFSGELQFGTGGIRAVMGLGSSLLNEYTIKKIAQGTADYFLQCGKAGDCAGNTGVNTEDNKASSVCKNAKDSVGSFGGGKRIVIAYDNRNNSRYFARLIASVLANNGIVAIVTKSCMPTPFLSFSVRKQRAAGGIMITASHNPKQYNGYKLYGADGCQLLDDESERVARLIENADPFTLTTKDFTSLQKQGMIRLTGAHKAYLAAVNGVLGERKDINTRHLNEGLYKEYDYKKFSVADSLRESIEGELRIIYTPLCGTGAFFAEKLLKKEGSLYIVRSQAKPDGEFATCAVPNPEKPEAFEVALGYAKKFEADLVIASDPDADRMGAFARSRSGEFEFLSGNQIGMLLADYLLSENLRMLKLEKEVCGACGKVADSDFDVAAGMPMVSCANGLDLTGIEKKEPAKGVANPVIVRTIVSTPLVDEIAKQYGAEIIKVPTGFKYIGDTIARLEEKGQADRFMFGFEESHGFLSGTYARDKDGLLAAALLARFATHLKEQGLTLPCALANLFEKHGYCLHKTISYRFEGVSGREKIKEFMARVRCGELLPSEKGDVKFTDYSKPISSEGEPSDFNKSAWNTVKPEDCAPKNSRANSESPKNQNEVYPAVYPADMVEYVQGGVSVIVRPSGTEPFIKAYLSVRADTFAETEEIIARYKAVCDKFFV